MIAAFLPLIWFFVLALAACLLVYFAIEHDNRSMQRNLDELAAKFKLSEGRSDDGTLSDHRLGPVLLEWAQHRLPQPNLQKPAVEKMVQAIQYAGFYNRAAPKIFQAIRLFSTGFGILLGYLMSALLHRMAAPLLFIGGGLGYEIPILSVRSMAKSRQLKIRKELPDIIDLLVVSVECGLGLPAAIRVVGRESERQGRIIGGQFWTLSNELTAGATLAEGLRGIGERTGVDDMKNLSAMLVQSEKLGTEIGQSLRATAEQLRVARSLRAEEAAQKLPIKMLFPMVLFLMPAMMMILLGPAMIEIFRAFKFH